MKFLILTIFLLITFRSHSQDSIILRNGEQIDCEITKVDSVVIYYDFYKGERKLSSYISKDNIHSYKINTTNKIPDNSNDMPKVLGNVVIIDTAKYVKETNKWVNLITYSNRYGLHAIGWSIQYYGYNLINTSKWSIPILFGIEDFTIKSEYFSKSGYKLVNMSYFRAGISPFYKLNEYFFLNLGANIIFGKESLTNFYEIESFNSFFGFSPSQGIYLIPKSKIGITLGLSIYEKVLSSEVYKNDIGVKLEAGIKF